MGKVYLIGSGPGDPGLLTLKGKDCLNKADVVIYDFLANDALLGHCRPGAELIYVGKQASSHTLTQDKINELLVEKAREASVVVRLKGGDPYIFGRGGEEAEVLKDAGIPFEVVPGVSSAVAAPAYAGIPLTHRRFASSVAFVTGHEDPTKEETRMKWRNMAVATDTLVFLMGVKNLGRIADHLIRNGRSPETPAALIQWGTTTRQRTLVSDLKHIEKRAKEENFQPPSVFVVGDVVSLRDSIAWFEQAPLFGKRILVTRSREQASALSERLSELGAEPVEFPTIRIREPLDRSEADRAVNGIDAYDWVIFTSINGVKYFLERMMQKGLDIRDLKGKRLAAIGPGTAGALESLGCRVDVVPKEYKAEALVEAIGVEDVKCKAFLIPRAKTAREVLPNG